MPADTKQIMDMAEQLGKLVAQHPAVEAYRQAQKSLGEDPDAGRLLTEFNRQIMNLSRQEESGLPVTDAQRHQLQALQGQLASHIKVQALNRAQTEFVDVMRRVSDTIRRQVNDGSAGPDDGGPQGHGPAPSGPQLVI